MPTEFTSHECIGKLIELRPELYNYALQERGGNKSPRQALHGKIGIKLKNEIPELTCREKKVYDADVNGNKSDNNCHLNY